MVESVTAKLKLYNLRGSFDKPGTFQVETAEVSFSDLALNKDIYKNFENSLPISKASAGQVYYDLTSLEQKLGSGISTLASLQSFSEIPEWLEEIKDAQSKIAKSVDMMMRFKDGDKSEPEIDFQYIILYGILICRDSTTSKAQYLSELALGSD